MNESEKPEHTLNTFLQLDILKITVEGDREEVAVSDRFAKLSTKKATEVAREAIVTVDDLTDRDIEGITSETITEIAGPMEEGLHQIAVEFITTSLWIEGGMKNDDGMQDL